MSAQHTTQHNASRPVVRVTSTQLKGLPAWTDEQMIAAHPSTRFRRSADVGTARAAPTKDRTERASAEAGRDTEPVSTSVEQPHARMPASTPSLTGRQPETQGSRNHSVHVSAVQPTICKGDKQVTEGNEAGKQPRVRLPARCAPATTPRLATACAGTGSPAKRAGARHRASNGTGREDAEANLCVDFDHESAQQRSDRSHQHEPAPQRKPTQTLG
jgi:hypothetical protein